MTSELSTMQLPELEAIIERGLASFIEVGNALIEIRDGRMYGSEYETFEEYVDKRFGFTRQRAYQLIDATKTAAEMSKIFDTVSLPVTESHVRALKNADSDPKQQERILKKAAKDAPKDANGTPRITASSIKAAAEVINGHSPTVAKSPGIDPEKARNDAIMAAQSAMPTPVSQFDPVELEEKAKSLVVDTTKPLAERITQQNKILESFCRSLVKFFDDNLPSDPWLDEGQVEIARSQLKSCCGAIRVAKAHDKPCPKCDGKGCKSCRKCGYLPKNDYQMIGGK